ncbi:MAG: acyltransferase domain-containing protein, partial [Gemmatimonadetes bacterium]|nr:acyltransferase domain-containing protein [Gemmatimonadota bacterium]
MSTSNTSGASETDIAVVGLAGRFPGAANPDQFWANLRDGVESSTPLTDEQLLAAGVDPALIADPDYVKVGYVLDGMEQFDAGFFGFSPRDAAIMDPQHRHFLECAWEAMEHAGHAPGRFDGQVGVFAGSGANTYFMFNLLTNPELVKQVGFFLLRHTGNDKDFLATRVSYQMNLSGPSVNVQTACSTSLVAVHQACQSLLSGECDMALAGGATVKQPHHVGYLYKEGEILSPDGHCRAFDAASEGTVFGSGVGVVVLRRLVDALRDGDTVHAVIKGSAINNDGSMKVGYLAPSVDGQAKVIAEALAIAGVEPESIGYVEAHGTGTPVGDPIEIAALTEAFRGGTEATQFCALGSLKTNVGHLDTAAGVAGLIKVVQALKHRQLPPTLHFSEPNPACGFEDSPFFVQSELADWKAGDEPRRAGVSSLGAGGTNAHVVLEEAPAAAPSGPSREWQLLVTSAKSATAADRAGLNLAEHLRANPDASLADVAYTLQVGREPFAHRRAVVVRGADDAVEALEDARRVVSGTAGEAERPVTFMFAGGGAQYADMGAGLYRTEPVFRDEVDRCLAILRSKVGIDLKPVLFPGEAGSRELERPSLALPALFTVQYALAKLWMSWGVSPSAMIGHSMGEYTAAHLAGVFSLEDALSLVGVRGRLFEQVPEGWMLSVPLPVEELRPLLGSELSVAAVNAPSLCAASGPVHAIDALERALAADDVECHRVRISIAAHSAMLDPILPEFGRFVRGIQLHAPTLPFISNVSGTWITAAEATDPEYWVRHLRGTVRFSEGMEELLKDAERLLLEVGPGRTLATLAKQQPAAVPARIATSLRHPDEPVDDAAFLLTSLGRLWAHGAAVDWSAFYGDERRRRVPLPTYAWDHQRYWTAPGKPAAAPREEGVPRKRADVGQWFYQPSWKRTVAPARAGRTGPVLLFADAVGMGAEMAASLMSAGRPVVRVDAGERFDRVAPGHFTINPSAPEHFVALLSELGAAGLLPTDVVHLWTVTGAEDVAPDLSFYSLLFLAQAMGAEDWSHPLRLTVVSSSMQQVAGETVLHPHKALLLGPCKVTAREFPNVQSRSVDVVLPAGTRPLRTLADRLLRELDGDPGDEVVALRGADRWAQSFEAVRLEGGDRGWIREGGVYLVT